MTSIKEVWRKVRTRPANLIVITKTLGGGTEQISANFYVEDLADLQVESDKVYAVIAARTEVVKQEMLKVEDEMRKKMAKAAKETK